MGKHSARRSRNLRKRGGFEVKYVEHAGRRYTAVWWPMDDPHDRPAPRARRVPYPRPGNKFAGVR